MPKLPATVLIVARDEAGTISRCVAGVRAIAAEVLVVDTGSSDDTAALAEAAGARVLHRAWAGYGPTKNWAATQASFPWIVSLDADEVPDAELARELAALELAERERVYGVRRTTWYVDRWVRHGSWRDDVVWRVYHREWAAWGERAVHERLVAREPGAPLARSVLAGELLHYSYPRRGDLARKHEAYIRLGVEALLAEGRRSTWTKRRLAPAWRFVRNYVFKGGWRDGRAGWEIATADYRMVRAKYRLLRQRRRSGGY